MYKAAENSVERAGLILLKGNTCIAISSNAYSNEWLENMGMFHLVYKVDGESKTRRKSRLNKKKEKFVLIRKS